MQQKSSTIEQKRKYMLIYELAKRMGDASNPCEELFEMSNHQLIQELYE